MDVLKENLTELEVGSTVESLQKFIDFQKELFHSQIDQLQKVVVTQCKLTGVNPLSQEMAAGALSIRIGKRPRDLLNPKAVKYMQAVFSIKDAISKKESREISALFGVTVTQVRDFFASQRTRVRKQVRLSGEKALRSNTCKETEGVVLTESDTIAPIEPVPLNSVGPVNVEESSSCSTQHDTLTSLDELDKHFVENIFNKMRKGENFSGQVKLMEWILQIQNPSVQYWFLDKGGVMILATWLSQAAVEEQTTVLFIILKVLCHLPLQKALPEQMSAILQSVNKLRLYRFSDISNRARLLISRWSKMLTRSQTTKKPNGLRSSTEAQNEMLLKQSISEIMGDESWHSNVDNSEGTLAISNIRKLESAQVLKLLPSSIDDTTKKNILGVPGSHSRERRKVRLVEQPGQKMAGKSSQTTRPVPVSQSRPMSVDDIQKAKTRALYLQSKYGATGSSNGMNEAKSEGLNKSSISQASFSQPVSKVPSRPAEEPKKPVILPPKTSNGLETSLHPKENMDSKEPLWEKCRKVKIPWHTPPEVKLNDLWTVGVGESSREVDMQKNRNRRERETFYYTIQEIPSYPKEPWDREMDYDDTLTPEIPTEQPPDTDSAEKQTIAHGEHVKNAATLAPSSSRDSSGDAAEPDLELLAVLLKNPALVFALTSGQGGNLTNEETVKLLDMIKAGGAGISNNVGKNVEEKVEVSLPSPTPSMDSGTGGWRSNSVVRNPFSQQSQMGNRVAQASLGVGTASPVVERLPVTSMAVPQAEVNGISLAQQLAAAMAQLLPQSNTVTPGKQQIHNVAFSHHGLPSNSPALQPPASDIALKMKNIPLANNLANLSAVAGHSLQVGTMSNVKPAPISLTPNAPGSMHSKFSVSPLMSTLSRPETPPQLRQQLANISDPSFQMHPYSTRPLNPMRNIGGAMAYPWRARQSLASNPHSQANQNNYNPQFGGSMQLRLRSGPPREGNEYVGNEGFESWSPENSPNRPSDYVQGRNYLEPRMNPRWSYGSNRSWRGGSPDYQEPNRQGNRKWHDRR